MIMGRLSRDGGSRVRAISRQRGWERQEAEEQGRALAACVEAGFLMAASNGELVDEELDGIANFIDGFCDGEASHEDIVGLVVKAAEALQRDGLEARLEALGGNAGTPEIARSALAVAAVVCMLDGEVDDLEEDAYYEIADALGLEDEEADEVWDAVSESVG
jgi:tellurite resistance protein